MRPGESFEQAQNFSPGGYKQWHEDGKRTWGRCYGPVCGAVPILYCIVIVCERVHAVWVTYFGVEIYILVQQYIFHNDNTYFRAALHISEEAVCTR